MGDWDGTAIEFQRLRRVQDNARCRLFWLTINEAGVYQLEWMFREVDKCFRECRMRGGLLINSIDRKRVFAKTCEEGTVRDKRLMISDWMS